jgi:hypothetical protein
VTRAHIQMVGLLMLSALAGTLLYLIGYTFQQGIAHVSPDGKVPLADAGLFTAILLSFQQTIQTMRSIWESQERTAMADNLSNSAPLGNAPTSAVEAAKQTADAAQTEADHIEGQAA